MLNTTATTPQQIVDARKEPLAGDAAWEILAQAREILVAKGKQYQRFDPKSDSRQAILDAALGRTGNLRAPVLRIGDRVLVGYSEGFTP